MTNKKKTEEQPTEAKVVKIELSAKEKSNAELAKGRVTEYEVPANELDIVHVELEQTELDRSSGDKKSKPYVQKFDDRAWNQFRANAKKLGYNHVRVLYAPEGTNVEVLDPVKAETKEEKKK